jgi:hypothetical protein
MKSIQLDGLITKGQGDPLFSSSPAQRMIRVSSHGMMFWEESVRKENGRYII